eukprot:COSAG02_NODE_206_length_29144_cov_12.855121_28_plen_59_part_00
MLGLGCVGFRYPRRAQMMTRSTCLDKPCTMGYSIVTQLRTPQGLNEFRYTECKLKSSF